MKILQISANWGHGGPGGVVKDIHNYISSNGHESHIAYGRYDLPNDVQSIKIGNRWDVYIHVLLTRLFDKSAFGSYSATKRLVKQIDELKPDVIHLHNLLGYYINIEVLFLYLKKANIPVVWTLHDCWAFTGHCINFERINCEKWLTGCEKCPLKNNYPESFLFDCSKYNYKKKKDVFSGLSNMILVTPSEWLAGLVSRSFLKEYSCYVINNGIDLTVFKPTVSDIKKRYGLQNKKLVLCVASVWNEMKGEHIVYQLAEQLDESYAIVMIGRKSSMNIPRQIIDLPRTQNISELVEWYSAADVFVNPTLGGNFPTVNIEALACGTPIITNNTGGSPEIAGNEYGRIVYSKEATEFIEKIEECILANYSSDTCRMKAMQFDRDRCFQLYENLYKNILKD